MRRIALNRRRFLQVVFVAGAGLGFGFSMFVVGYRWAGLVMAAGAVLWMRAAEFHQRYRTALIHSSSTSRIWTGGKGRWSDPRHWKSTALDAPGAPAPTRIDDVFISGKADVYVDVDAYCRLLDMTGLIGTFTVRPRRTPWYWLRTAVGRRPAPTVTLCTESFIVRPSESDLP